MKIANTIVVQFTIEELLNLGVHQIINLVFMDENNVYRIPSSGFKVENGMII